jgi:hypothetical protein
MAVDVPDNQHILIDSQYNWIRFEYGGGSLADAIDDWKGSDGKNKRGTATGVGFGSDFDKFRIELNNGGCILVRHRGGFQSYGDRLWEYLLACRGNAINKLQSAGIL